MPRESRAERNTADVLTAAQREVLGYVSQMSAQLAVMAADAGQATLARMLSDASEEAQVITATSDLSEP